MNELMIFEQGLVPVYKTDKGEFVVNGRELWDGLKVKTDFSTWAKRRLADCEALENEDYALLPKKEEQVSGAKYLTEYLIKLDIAKEMAMLERNEVGKQVRKYFIAVEKKLKQAVVDISSLSPELQMFKQIFDSVAQTQLQQKQQEKAIEDTNKRIDSIKDVISLNPISWRKETRDLLVKTAQCLGGNDYIRNLQSEAYDLVAERSGVRLQIRLTNKCRRMAEEGVCKSKRDKLNKLDVIAEDKKLIEIYVAVIKEMAIKYGACDVAS